MCKWSAPLYVATWPSLHVVKRLTQWVDMRGEREDVCRLEYDRATVLKFCDGRMPEYPVSASAS